MFEWCNKRDNYLEISEIYVFGDWWNKVIKDWGIIWLSDLLEKCCVIDICVNDLVVFI